MNRYRVTYRDENDPSAPDFDTVICAHDREGVELQFYESNDGDSWVIVSIEELRS